MYGFNFGAQPDPFNYETEQQRIKRLLSQAAMFQKNTAAPQGQMVGGQFVAPHWSQQLAPVLNNVLGGLFNQYADQASQDLEKGSREQAMQWMASKPKAQTQVLGSVEEPLPAGIQIQGEQPTRDDMLKWAMGGATNPLTKTLAAKYLEDQLIAEPDREAKRKDTIDLAREKMRADNETKMAQLKVQMDHYAQLAQDRAASLEERKRANLAMEELRKYTLEQQDRHATEMLEFRKQGGQVKPDRLPASQTNAFLGNEQLVSNIDRALANVGTMKDGKFVPAKDADANFNAAYGVANAIPGGSAIASKINKEGTGPRAAVYEIAGQKIHDRSGTAVSISERDFLRPYIPAPGDSPEEVYQKLNQLKTVALGNNDEIRKYADAVGYIMPGGKYSYGAPAPVQTPAASSSVLPKATGRAQTSEAAAVRQAAGTLPDTRSPEALRTWIESIRKDLPNLNGADKAEAQKLLAQLEQELQSAGAAPPQSQVPGVKRRVQW